SPHSIIPVVIMSGPAKACLDPPKDKRFCILEVSPYQIGIGYSGAVRSSGIFSSGGEIIAVSPLLQGSIVSNHGIYGACRNAPEQARLSQPRDVLAVFRIRLRNNSHSVSGPGKDITNNCYTYMRTVDIGITCYKNYVQALPTALFHLFPSCRQKHALSFCPQVTPLLQSD